MNRWMSRCAALIGTVLSLSSFAQVCQETTLYRNGENGKLEQMGNSFPEFPEWKADWGEMNGLMPPYIRLSGMKNDAGDWTGLLNFEALPLKIQGGFLKTKVRSTQNARLGLWLKGSFGTSQIYFKSLVANQTEILEIPLKNLVGENTVLVENVGLGLFDVAAYQYTTLFVDDVVLTCGLSEQSSSDLISGNTLSTREYVYENLDAASPRRRGKFTDVFISPVYAAYTAEQRKKLLDSTSSLIVIDDVEHQQIKTFMETSNMDPQRSRKGWFRNMYFLARGSLKDSVFANPKALLHEAELFSAEEEHKAMPILVANVDYSYRACADSSCEEKKIKPSRLLQVGLPTAKVNSSRIKIYYDPYFVATNRKDLPILQVNVNKTWKALTPKSEMELEFESAGVQKIEVKVSEGGLDVKQNLFVEVQ